MRINIIIKQSFYLFTYNIFFLVTDIVCANIFETHPLEKMVICLDWWYIMHSKGSCNVSINKWETCLVSGSIDDSDLYGDMLF
jgi:hypothetical protein